MTTAKDDTFSFENKLNSLRTVYPFLRDKSDEYVFQALCIKANLYKNPANTLSEDNLKEMIVDGSYDGGVDILLTDPNSQEDSDLVIAQCKYYAKISSEEVLNAVCKMANFYKDMISGDYRQISDRVQRRFFSLQSDLSDEAKIHFVFYTSSAQNSINTKRIDKKLKEMFSDPSKIELSLYFSKDIEEEIKESESLRPSVESGKICIDRAGNILTYGEEAVIVNVSALSIKKLYGANGVNLFAGNLRYYIKNRDIDQGIETTIREEPESFWLKNNGITIVCEDFSVDGKEVKMKNFSIINGGQTTYILHRSKYLVDGNDFYLPCKIIKTTGETQDEKTAFNLGIAKATNTQKPIKAVDLKANAPEQVRFVQAMRQNGVFYQTKRGEVIPKNYKQPYLNSSLVEVGKLCLAAVFQAPGMSRSKPSSMYQPKYYNVMFDGDQNQIARLCRELLYIDFYFRNKFLKEFDAQNEGKAGVRGRIPFAHNARTVCIAFVALASRYYQGNITEEDMQTIFDSANKDENSESRLYDIFSRLGEIKYLIPPEVFKEKDSYDEILSRLFNIIIDKGVAVFSLASEYDSSLNATNFLKKDKNYYKIIKASWNELSRGIEEVFEPILHK